MASMASEVKFDFIFEIGNHNYPGIHVHIMPITATLVASEAMAASKQLRSQMASMNSITYVSMSLWPLKASISLIERRLIIIPRPAGFAAGKNTYPKIEKVSFW